MENHFFDQELTQRPIQSSKFMALRHVLRRNGLSDLDHLLGRPPFSSLNIGGQRFTRYKPVNDWFLWFFLSASILVGITTRSESEPKDSTNVIISCEDPKENRWSCNLTICFLDMQNAAEPLHRWKIYKNGDSTLTVSSVFPYIIRFKPITSLPSVNQMPSIDVAGVQRIADVG